MPDVNDQIPGVKGAGQVANDASRDLLASLVRSSSDAMIIETLDDIITYWNPSAERLYGYTAEEVIGHTLSMLIPPHRLDETAEIMRRVRGGEHMADVETVRLRKDGRRIDISLAISPVWNDAGEIIATSAIVRDITARKRTEQALAASEALLQVAFENAPIGMMMTSPEPRMLRVNLALCQMLGYAAEELLATDPWAFTHPDDFAPNQDCVERALAGEITSYELEKRYIHRDGHIIWGKLHGSLARDADGAPRYFISQILDITQRKAAEAELAQRTEELRTSEARYRTLVEQLPGAVYLLANDEQQTPLYYSQHIEQITGETPEETIVSHRLWLDLVHPEDYERVAAEDARHGEETDLFQVEYRHRHKDGSYVWVRDECVPVHDDAGQVVAWQGVMLDITDRMQATEAQAQLAALVESAEDAIVSSTLDGTITSWNRGAEYLYGYRAEEIIGQSFRQLLPDDLVEPTLEHLRSAAQPRHAIAPFETTRRRKDGAAFAASVSLSPIRDHTGHVTGISSITRDITERKQAESALQQALIVAEAANEAKSQFLTMMSHELRTPLQAILGYAEFLLADPTSLLSADERVDVSYIQQGGLRMLALINHLLDLSRIEAGRFTLMSKVVDLADILEQVRQDVAPMAIQKRLDLCIEAPASLPLVTGDPDRIRQILLNLAGNAVKFTEQGSVHITAETIADGVAVSVRDTGIGIPSEDLSTIFEAFRQVDSRLSRRHEGAGLGMAIAQKLAELMRGSISVESALGDGSTFTLLLPVASPDPASTDAS